MVLFLPLKIRKENREACREEETEIHRLEKGRETSRDWKQRRTNNKDRKRNKEKKHK